MTKVKHTKRELAQNKDIENKDWSRFLPKFNKNVKKHGKKPKKTPKKPYTPFPPPQTPRKVDLQLLSGEYFLGPDSILQKEKEKMAQKRREKRRMKKEELLEVFNAPDSSDKEEK